MEWYLGPLKKYAQFSGRASRKEYWLFRLWNLPIMVVLGLINPALLGLYYLGILLPLLAVGARRLHDTNRSGWWLLLSLVPFAGIAVIVFFCLEGTDGDNDYGPSPLASSAAAPGSVVTGPGPTPAITPSGPPPAPEIRQPTSSSDALGAPPNAASYFPSVNACFRASVFMMSV